MLNDVCIPAFDNAIRATLVTDTGRGATGKGELVDLFRKYAGISDALPEWFTAGDLGQLPEQHDQARLIQMAERVWPEIDWIPLGLTNRNRASWYRAVVRQRGTNAGWILDQDTVAPNWGNGLNREARAKAIH